MLRLFLFGCGVVALAGCSATHLVYVHDVSVGIDASVSTEGTTKLSFGYDRETYAIVPKQGDGKEAMSLAGTSCVYSSGLGSAVRFNHLIATGGAAADFAKAITASAGSVAAAVAAVGREDSKCER